MTRLWSNGPSTSPPRKSPAPASAGRSRRASPSRRTNAGDAPTRVTATIPELVSELGAAAVRGFQGRNFPPNRLPCWPARNISSATAARTNGVDQGNTVCDEATLRKLYLPPYRAAIKAGVGSIMVSYSSWNGQKMHGNKHLLTDVLKSELGFQGFLVSDWAAIDQLSPDYKRDVETIHQRRHWT